jgi:hypothetical protein
MASGNQAAAVIVVDANGNRYLQLPAEQHIAPAGRSGRPISDTSSVRSHSPARSVNSVSSNTTVSTVSSVNFKDHTKSRRLLLKQNGRPVEYKFQTIAAKLEWTRKHRPDLLPPSSSLLPPSPSLLPPPPSPIAGPVAVTQDGPYRTLNEIDIGTLNENYHPVTNNTTNNTTNYTTNYTTNHTTNYNLTHNYSPQVPVTPSQVGNLVQGSGGLFDGPALLAPPAPRRRIEQGHR